ncbi:MAG: DUF501 domain-containing protein [Candidatus Bipolaricaulota bacterium]
MDRLPTERDLQVICWQIGRAARGVIAVAATCRYGFPQVTVNKFVFSSEQGFELFPNVFWLTCPYLVQEVGRLEAAGGVRDAEQLIRDDPGFAERYLDNHRAYREERRRLLCVEEVDLLRAVGREEAADTGIGGLRNHRRVKCLHVQLAHFLARGSNPVGELVADRLPALACPPEEVRCWAGLE